MRPKRQLTGAALTAKMIKKRLLALYPNVKFSVKSDTFSMGNSVDIRWQNGPTRDAVDEITRQYQYGSFDSMNDAYNYTKIDASLGCEGAKYVQCHRETTTEHMAMLHKKAEEQYGKLDPNDFNYYQRINDIEKEFFPYPVSDAKPSKATAHDGTQLTGLEINILKDVDTRDNSVIYVVKIVTTVSDFKALRNVMDSYGGYYSRFKKGFIFKEDPTEKFAAASCA